MRPHDSLWQGCFGYWQDQFIRENLLPLGHAAWQGFITQGRGMVVCDMAIVNAASMDWICDVVEYAARYIPVSDVSAYLHTLNLEASFIERLIGLIQTYTPAREILLLINENGRADINLLQHLAISPADCYQQMQQRWLEFQLEYPTQWRKL